LQSFVSSIGQRFLQKPPSLGGVIKLRFLNVWPPPQSASHFIHSAHAENSQATASGLEQGTVSMSEPLKRLPSPLASCEILRSRYLCGWIFQSHEDHELHAPGTASCDGHALIVHSRDSSVAPEHGPPPCSAGVAMRRIRRKRPLPHVTLHVVHSRHSAKAQFIGGGAVPQASVSFIVPSQAVPPLFAGWSTPRVRKRWSLGEAHKLHSLQLDNWQFCAWSKHSGFTISFVAILGPSQGWPHSLFTVWMDLSL
jgi:hypothetical protein